MERLGHSKLSTSTCVTLQTINSIICLCCNARCFSQTADTEGQASVASQVAMDQGALSTTAATRESRRPPFSTRAFNQHGQSQVPDDLAERMAKLSALTQRQSMAASGSHSPKEHQRAYQVPPSAELAAFARPGVNRVPFSHPIAPDAGVAAFGSGIIMTPFTGATVTEATQAEPSEPGQAARKFLRP